MKASVCAFVLVFLGGLCSSNAQFQQQLANILSGLGNIALDGLSSNLGGAAAYDTCIPYDLPAQFESYQDFCRYLSQLPDDDINTMFQNGRGPQNPYEPFPLKGCVLGCIIGQQSYERGMMWGSGSWSGKCIRNKDIKNLLTPLPSLGGAMTVMDTFVWKDMLPVTERYPGTISVDWSWWDGYNTLASSGSLNRVWTLSYDDVQIPEVSPDAGPMGQLQAAYPKLVKGSRDEVRLVEPGLVVGQLFRRPNSYLNPLPVPVDSGIKFAMIQVCDGDRYAWNGNLRDL
jgi:hypothetical protein